MLLIAVGWAAPPPSVPSTVGVSLVHSTATASLSPQSPITWPLLLIATAMPPQSGKVVAVPLLTTQGFSSGATTQPHWPAIWPESLIPYACDMVVPLSAISLWPFHRNGLPGNEPPLDGPTTSPESLIATPWLKSPLPPSRAPRSVIVPLLHKNAWSGFAKHFFCPPYCWGGHGTCTCLDKTESPVTWPEALIASARVIPPPSEPRSVIVYVVAAAAGAAAAAGRPAATASTAIKARGEVRNRVMTLSLRARGRIRAHPVSRPEQRQGSRDPRPRRRALQR